MSDVFDLIVIGGGPGGYSAAIRGAQKGLKSALIEKDALGGTCLNRGCIPSKALLGSAHFISLARYSNLMGLEIEGLKPNWSKMQSRKDAIVNGFTSGVGGLLKSNGVEVFQGTGIITEPGKVKVARNDGDEVELETKNVIIATGSIPIEIPAFKFDKEVIISSTEALSLTEVPQSMVIIGGGVIGCEMACVYATLGCNVSIVEALPSLLPNEDQWVGNLLAKEFKKLKINSLTGKKVTGVEVANGSAKVNLESGEVIDAEKVLVAVGRRAIVDNDTVANLGLEMDRSIIKVNEKMETNVKGVYAIGDVVGTTYLAHGAFMEAEVAIEQICGGDKVMEDYHLIPRAVYSFPEVASVGRSEKKCKEMGIEIYVGKAAFRTNGRSVAHNETVGEVQVIKNKADDKIMGVTMVGATVTEMIAAARALIGTNEDILDICFPHPTVSEVLKEAWEDAYGLSVHVPPKK